MFIPSPLSRVVHPPRAIQAFLLLCGALCAPWAFAGPYDSVGRVITKVAHEQHWSTGQAVTILVVVLAVVGSMSAGYNFIKGLSKQESMPAAERAWRTTGTILGIILVVGVAIAIMASVLDNSKTQPPDQQLNPDVNPLNAKVLEEFKNMKK